MVFLKKSLVSPNFDKKDTFYIGGENMMLYQISKIVSIGKTYIITETNFVGHIVLVAKPDNFIKGKVSKVFIYDFKNDHVEARYGFNTFEERIFFEDLIGVPGIGPKTAMAILKEGHKEAIQYIAAGDFQSLSSYPYIGIKTCRHLVFELQNKYSNMLNKNKVTKNQVNINDVKETLKTLGFKTKQIIYAMEKIKPNSNIESMVEEAIRVMANERI